MRRYYWSDTHLGHEAALEVFQRPFPDLQTMDARLEAALREVLSRPDRYVFHLGDVAFGLRQYLRRVGEASVYSGSEFRDRLALIAGNHDGVATSSGPLYRAAFGEITGTERTWADNVRVVEDVAYGRKYRLLLSHRPQRDLRGCDFNLYGHIHNFLQRSRDAGRPDDWGWLLASDDLPYINVSAELVDYRPRTLEELLRIRATDPLWLR